MKKKHKIIMGTLSVIGILGTMFYTVFAYMYFLLYYAPVEINTLIIPSEYIIIIGTVVVGAVMAGHVISWMKKEVNNESHTQSFSCSSTSCHRSSELIYSPLS